jgi:hypothetical protein
VQPFFLITSCPNWTAHEKQQALAPELAEEGETEAQAEWREVLTSARLPAPRLGPVAVKRLTGRGRGLVASAAVAEGQLLMVAAPLGILYCKVRARMRYVYITPPVGLEAGGLPSF